MMDPDTLIGKVATYTDDAHRVCRIEIIRADPQTTDDFYLLGYRLRKDGQRMRRGGRCRTTVWGTYSKEVIGSTLLSKATIS
jgi:hypothetical protein